MHSHTSGVELNVKRLDFLGAVEAARALWRLPISELYTINFQYLEWVEPFGMLYFARQLRAFGDQRKPARCRAINHQAHGYAAHMGFFQTFGLSFGNSPENSPGNDRYIGITKLCIRDLHIAAGSGATNVQDVVEMRASEMASVLAHGESGHVQATLTFSLREVLRNVVEHANADDIWYSAQYLPEKQTVELAVLDQGIGVRSALSRNPHIQICSDADALRLAILPGISGAAYEGRVQKRNDGWINSGYGLYMTSQLCARGGSFLLCSGDSALLLQGGTETIVATEFAGTALRLCIHVPQIQGLAQSLRTFNDVGTSLARNLGYPANVEASASSRMVHHEFE